MMTEKKRDDIQCLRAIAIIAVLLFHIWPDIFKNGYAGVDIFFVLSGYLMTMILSKKELNRSTILDFYKRRIIRIMPNYILLLISIIFIGGYLLTTDNFIELIHQAIYAELLIFNIRTLVTKEDYFKEVESYNFLLHTWSLAVELQYYLLVPLIFYLIGNSKQKTSQAYSILIALLNCSFLLYIFMYFWYESFSFNFTLCRIWQFIVGSLAYFYSNRHKDIKTLVVEKESLLADSDEKIKDTNKGHINKNIIYPQHCWKLFIPLLYILLLGSILNCEKIPEIVNRVSATFITGLILAYYNLNTQKIFNNAFLSYIGDISYMLYLVHWPTIQFFKYYGALNGNEDIDSSNNLFIKFTYFGLSLLISIILYHIFEKPLLSLKNKQDKILISTIFCQVLTIWITLYISYNPNISSVIQMKNTYINNSNPHQIIIDLYSNKREIIIKSLNDENVIQLNNFLALEKVKDEYKCEENEKKFTYKFPEIKGAKYMWKCESMSNGTLNVLIIGNSHANDAFPAIRAAFRNNYKILRIFALNNCIPFEIYTSGICKNAYEIFKKIIIDIKPNVLFLIFKYNEPDMRKTIAGNDLKNDKLVQIFQKSLNFFSEHVKTILFNGPNLFFPFMVRKELIKRLTIHMNTSTMNIPLKDYISVNENLFKRLNAIKCNRCTYIDLKQIFCDDDFCYAYDPSTKLAYFRDGDGHLTLYGRYKLYKPMETYLKSALKMIESKI